MTAKDTITLPREVVEQLLKMLEMVEPYADQLTDYSSTAAECPLNLLPEKVGVAITALRTHLTAEQPKPEPVAWMRKEWSPDCGPYFDFYAEEEMGWRDRKEWTPLYTAPPALAQPSEDVEALRQENQRLTKANDALALINAGNLTEIRRLRDDQQKVLDWVEVIKQSYREEQRAQETRSDAHTNIKKICEQSLR